MIREDGDYHNWTGCGNTLNLSHPAVTHFAYECLKYWVETFHVDGFRFDLAPVMGRTPGFSQQAPLFEAIKTARCSRVKLIAEPWDIGEGGYQVGTSRHCLLNGTTTIAMPYAASGWREACRWESSPDALPLPAICLNVMANDRLQPSTW